VINDEEKYCADCRDYDAGQITPVTPTRPSHVQIASPTTAHQDAEDDIPHQLIPGAIHNLAADEAGDEPEDQSSAERIDALRVVATGCCG